MPLVRGALHSFITKLNQQPEYKYNLQERIWNPVNRLFHVLLNSVMDSGTALCLTENTLGLMLIGSL
jgi:hypothetical protein